MSTDNEKIINLIKIWKIFSKTHSELLNNGITDALKIKKDWNVIPDDLKYILEINNGQNGKSKKGIFGKLKNGKPDFNYHFLDFNSIIRTYEQIKDLKIPNIDDNQIPFSILENEKFAFTINKNDLSINHISFNEYDYNGGTVHHKSIFKYADNMIEFINHQILLLKLQ